MNAILTNLRPPSAQQPGLDLPPSSPFSEKIRTRAISAKGMTLISPLQLLLFACKKINSNGDVVELDDWRTTVHVHHLRAGLEALVVEVTKDPEYIRQLDQSNERLLNLIRHISRPSAAGLNLMSSTHRTGREVTMRLDSGVIIRPIRTQTTGSLQIQFWTQRGGGA
ncbi:ATP-dependent RNA helicase A [Lates japonicus]|uniref:ATP-dependent RNA helicase A n=1 Tax=Lates japonicus TaxID=270547 RepID=A0AAD3RGY4_LATJO|nr:ATP-dependent RNA helicase A [Lates japonicus]